MAINLGSGPGGSVAGADYDQIVVNRVTDPVTYAENRVTLAGALTVTALPSLAPTIGTVYTILKNQTVYAIDGRFDGKLEDAEFDVGAVRVRISYIGTDGANDPNPNNVTLTVISAPSNAGNTPPVAAADSATTSEDTSVMGNVLGNDTDADGDTLSAWLVSGPAHGTLALGTDGSFDYTPDLHYSGSDTFGYRAADGHGGFATATVTITVTPVSHPPTTGDESVTTTEDGSVTGNVLSYVTDVDGDYLTA